MNKYLILSGAALLSACNSAPPQGNQPLNCPVTPNCVSSEATSPARRVAPLELTRPDQSWEKVGAAVEDLPRTQITSQTDSRIDAVSRTKVFRFADDLTLVKRAGEDAIEIRSASRLGYVDLGVNRKRVEQLRSKLKEQGVVR